MFVKPITYGDVRVGDVVKCRKMGICLEVERISPPHGGEHHVALFVKERGGIRVLEEYPNHPIDLAHRPWPRDEREMREEVLDKAHDLTNHPQLGSFDEKLGSLREVIEAYELGKPFDPN